MGQFSLTSITRPSSNSCVVYENEKVNGLWCSESTDSTNIGFDK